MSSRSVARDLLFFLFNKIKQYFAAFTLERSEGLSMSGVLAGAC